MTELRLIRTYHPEGTNGVLWHGEKQICQTIELPWRNNRRMISCIPEGRYRLIRREHFKHGDQLAVTGVPGREAILIHPANFALAELQGCIAPVTKVMAPGKGVFSRVALERLKDIAYPALEAGEAVWLTIVQEGVR
ncbi:hypothetical protein GCM10011386_39320 [Parapedobacter defluvii]|uniref:DUF5675 domain-containing protein n=1 Tax=Parapedobacter defluvii TaxID=2045106 RepID=A0ABQ1MMG7_9SPHI|nr:DUF5675 family protein [Parapedobacter defluvii]GGC43178.1 hypothetical protein GCM10011386_39320 [Parapedobacter defluvii]